MKRVTCREIGEKLGLSHSTVSLALRDHPCLPEATKEKVRKMATELGYRPDPALGALNAYRQAGRGTKYQSTLAWINPYPESLHQFMPEWLEAATRRAEALGFQLERFWVQTYDDWCRLARALRSRGIQGFVRTSCLWHLNPDWNLNDERTLPWRDFPWENFSVISVGQIAVPEHHLVVHHHFQGAGLAVAELAALGYRKIGIVLHSIEKRGEDFRWLGGYLAECTRRGLAPLYLVDGPINSPHYTEHVAKWVLRHRPEVVIASGDGDILPALRLAKLRMPLDIAVAALCVMDGHPELAAIDQNYRQIGEVVINQLVDLIRRNERGVPSSPLDYFVKGTWVGGVSAPPKIHDGAGAKNGDGSAVLKRAVPWRPE